MAGKTPEFRSTEIIIGYKALALTIHMNIADIFIEEGDFVYRKAFSPLLSLNTCFMRISSPDT